ncbi:MAG: hypothetical protein QOI88_2655 [Gammaproteobacteria bacterium]|nr:hypothetical protein [Gammaproteobacteria bacterium]
MSFYLIYNLYTHRDQFKQTYAARVGGNNHRFPDNDDESV